MGISVADNFSYLGGKPLDGRIQYATLAAMKSMADATLYEGCKAYCVETDKYYKWLSSNTVDIDTGKWREVESGGGSIPVATANTLGGIKVGSGLTITQDGTLSALSAPVALGDVSNVAASIVNTTTGEVHISWDDPDDVPGETGGYLAQWQRTLVVKKVGSTPTSPSDGTTICTNLVKNQYSAGVAYVTDTISTDPTVNTYYRFFPVSTSDITTYGYTRRLSTGSFVYGFKITQTTSDPSTRVTYLEDAAGLTPAHMDYTNNVFDYGGWEDIFLVKNIVPVMLNNDGTEAYQLDPDDLTKKADGTASDIANTSFAGNAMMRIPKVYVKVVKDTNNDISVYLAGSKIDGGYECWAHHDDQGNEIPYLYMPIFNGFVTDGKMRSLSGATPTVNTADTTLISYCDANNSANKHIWSASTFSAWELMAFMMVLISKSTNIQAAFGLGRVSGSALIASGTGNDKGLFYGTQTSAVVKIFGMENPYGNCWKRVIGLGNYNGVGQYKLTYGQEDGTTADGYTQTMTGYKSADYTFPAVTSGNIATMEVFDNILLPKTVSGTSEQYYCDALTSNNSGDKIAICGGSTNNNNICGPFMFALDNAIGFSYTYLGTSIECRPRLGEESIVS